MKAEYKSHDLKSSPEDEKRFKKAREASERGKKASATMDDDNQLFRFAFYIVISLSFGSACVSHPIPCLIYYALERICWGGKVVGKSAGL